MVNHDKQKCPLKALVSEVVESKEKGNKLLDLVAYLEESRDEPAKKIRALHAVSRAFVHVIRRGDLAGKDDGLKRAQWVAEVLEEVRIKLLGLVVVPGNSVKKEEKRVSELAMTVFMQLLVVEHESLVANNDDQGRAHWTGPEVKTFRRLVACLASSEEDTEPQVDRFREYLEYHDVKQHLIQGLAKLVHSRRDTGKANSKGRENQQLGSDEEEDGGTSDKNTRVFRSNVLKLLEVVNFGPLKRNQKPETLLCKVKRSDQGNDQEKASSSSSCYDFNYDSVRKAFSSLWEDFFKLCQEDNDPHHPTYKRVLMIVHDRVMPHLTRPLLLTDFLMESYKVGGSISLLALNGVFHLIQHHNLEYPDFYTKLYSLLNPEVLHVKYRARFFHLMDLFMSSTHLPEYLVAAFIKRISRLALTGPADALIMILPFLGNLLLRHRSLEPLVNAKVDGEEDFSKDPYDFYEPDPVKSRALESSLWEIRTLQSHALPQISQQAKFINKQLPQMEWDLSQVLEMSYVDMMEVEAKKKVFVNVPLTFERPDSSKSLNDCMVKKYFN